MRQVVPYVLWIGNALDARDLQRLYELEIVAVIDLALEEKPAQLGREIVYCRFPLIDGGGNSPVVLCAAVEMTVRFVKEKVPTLVACGAGMAGARRLWPWHWPESRRSRRMNARLLWSPGSRTMFRRCFGVICCRQWSENRHLERRTSGVFCGFSEILSPWATWGCDASLPSLRPD